MSEIINIWLQTAEKTVSSGEALARTLHTVPVDILLSGELGAGKTTFLQGLAKGLGIKRKIVSPTFALEQRHPMSTTNALRPDTEFIHIDLYRLHEKQSRQLLESTHTHTGIRCIEWPEHAGMELPAPKILIALREEGEGRIATITFDDIALPTREQIEEWRSQMRLPEHIARHCDAVADLSGELGEILLKRGMPVRQRLLRRGAEAHDLFRFLDFRPGGFAGPDEHTDVQLRLWADLRKKYAGLKHEPACAAFLEERGFPAVAAVVRAHGLTLPAPERRTIEQQLLFYADKRVMIDQRVTLEERFADFRARYNNGTSHEESEVWLREAKDVEQGLGLGDTA